jgi:hypothetical protein
MWVPWVLDIRWRTESRILNAEGILLPYYSIL